MPIFKYNQLWLVLLYCGFMIWVSALEAVGRPAKTFNVSPPVPCCCCMCPRPHQASFSNPNPPTNHTHAHMAAQGLFLNTLLIVACSASLIMAYALLVVMGVQPWWTPQYLIPILGM